MKKIIIAIILILIIIGGTILYWPKQQTEFVSQKGVKIKITSPRKNQVVSSPIRINGEVPGNWSFEGSFPVLLMAENQFADNKTPENGWIVTQNAAKLTGDWMTTSYVPFSDILTFDLSPVKNTHGVIILKKDNPSGQPENDDSVEIPVVYK